MLRQENKILLIVLLCLSFVACKRYVKYDIKEIYNIRIEAMDMSKSVIGNNEYNNIYNNVKDSINNWIENQIDYIKYYNDEREWLLDSIMCINSDSNKLITAVLKRSMYNDSNADFIDYFYGVKIKGKWYFFRGAGMVLPREYYQKDIHTPLSFEKLKQIATYNIYRRYLIKNKQGEWKVNEKFFENLSKYDAYSRPFATQDTYDESWLMLMKENWNKRDK
jgi:hypothetical protein